MPHMPQDTLTLNKAAAPILSFHVKSVKSGIGILRIFAEKEEKSIKTKQSLYKDSDKSLSIFYVKELQ